MHKLAVLVILSGITLLACKKNDDTGADPEPFVPEPTVVDPIACDQCSHVITGSFDGLELEIEPGDTVCLEGGVEYGNLTITNLIGTEESPIIIKNCDEKVAIVNPSGTGFGVKFEYSSYFKLLGNGGGGDYGIKISTDNGFFLTLQTFTTNFEIANVEIAGKSTALSGFAGIGIKTSPYEDCDAFTDEDKDSNWIMYDISVHDNYIHDVGGEGLYIGHGFYNGRTESQCTDRTYSHSIRGVRVFNNIIQNVGYDGIQLKNCDEDVIVFNNIIDQYALNREGAHDEGIYIGDGTTGRFYNNYINDGGTGIFVHGMGYNDIYNNVISNVYDYAFYASGGPNVYRFEDGYFNVINNTFHCTGEYGAVFFESEGGVKRFYNNIFVATEASEIFRKGVELDSSNNILTRDVDYIKFVDFNSRNLQLQEGSPAIDAGINPAEIENWEGDIPSADVLGKSRESGIYDIGAFEF